MQASSTARQPAPEPRLSIVTPVTDPSPAMLEGMLASVRAQSCGKWELCLCAGCGCPSQLRELLDAAAERDPRIGVRYCDGDGVAAVAAGALAMARGDFVGLLGDRDRLDRDALAAVDEAIRFAPDLDVVYTDEDALDPAGRQSDPLFKPDWSPERLRAEMYIGRLSFLRRSLVEEVGGLDPMLDGAAEWDLTLRVTEQARVISHVPRLLYHRRTGEGAGGVDGGRANARAVEAHCRRIGLPARVEVDPSRAGGCRLTPALEGTPLVSIVMPTCGQSRPIRGRDEVLVLHCARSILGTSTYGNFEIVCVADDSTDPSTLEELRAVAGERLRVVAYDQPFNFSAKVNLGAAHSEGEHLLLLNDDMEVVTPGWIERLVMYAGQEGIGAVGAQLRWEDERVQHAGIVLERGLPGHIYRGAHPGELTGYARNALISQDYLAVTGACLMTPRDIFARVGGFPTELPVNYNDVDYCLKLREQGLRVAYDADTVLYHFESSSRDTKVNAWEKSFLRERWESIGRDPYSNPGLRYGEPRPGLLRRVARFAKASTRPSR